MAPSLKYFSDIQRFMVIRKKIYPFSDSLEHAEFDSVVDQLHKVPGAGGPRMNVASRN